MLRLKQAVAKPFYVHVDHHMRKTWKNSSWPYLVFVVLHHQKSVQEEDWAGEAQIKFKYAQHRPLHRYNVPGGVKVVR